MEQVTMAELPSRVICGWWKDVAMRRAIRGSLRFPPIDGLLPFVPGKVERDAMVGSRVMVR
jgi:hypothetical protein